jgi:hypothetical protein
MTVRLSLIAAMLLLAPHPAGAQQVEEVRDMNAETPTLPEDLFRLPPGSWYFAKQLWKGDEPCTADACEAGFNSGDLVVSVERSKTYLRIVAGFRGCKSVAWNQYEIGKSASSGDTKTVNKNIKKTVETSAKYCKVSAPSVPTLDTRQLYPVQPAK